MHLRPRKWRMSLPILEEEEAHERKAGMAIVQQPRADKSASHKQFYLSGCGIHADDPPISLVRGVADDHAVEVGIAAKTQEKQPVAAIQKSQVPMAREMSNELGEIEVLISERVDGCIVPGSIGGASIEEPVHGGG
ncbi:hypothetical protein BHE74_00039451 [Ensete ventricosum]|nr:hypothetical protein BHE74_00039451 [Ensete ventricosum]